MDLEDVPMLSQPLLTEEGFVNPACINELTAAINKIPPIHIRCANDPEWNTPRWTYWREITGAFAYWAVRQINEGDDTPFPPGLEKVVGFLSACIRRKFDKTGVAQVTLCEIGKWLFDILMSETIFLSWNDEKVLKGWLDLDALIGNVCVTIRDERRKNDAFDLDFDRRWAAEHQEGNYEI